MFPWHQYLLSLIFIIAGVTHFTKTKLYVKIMPSYLPSHSTLVLLSGIFEMIVGFLLLNPATRSFAAWSMMALLLLFIPIHIHMLQNEKAALKLPKWLLIVRLPLQLGLIYWAYQYI